jgi:hypothetical protein
LSLPITGNAFKNWHGLEKGRAISDDEVDYVVGLIMGWIERQIVGKRDLAV